MGWLLVVITVTVLGSSEAPVQRFPTQAECQAALRQAFTQKLRVPLLPGAGRLMKCVHEDTR